jgi:uncharacterized protein (DUF2235 family)
MGKRKERMHFTYKKQVDTKPQARKHIILIDGTWNDESGLNLDGLITNIAKLNKIFISDEKQQIVRYHRGIGNDNDNNFLKKLTGGITAAGFMKIVDKAYARFVQDWQNGDEIYIFGFSRGAAMARLLAKKINENGIPESVSVTIKPKANKENKVVEQAIINPSFVPRNPIFPVKIEFLGVWDTVSSFGFFRVLRRALTGSNRDIFTGRTIANNIKKAVHLVAIDETRNPFTPSLMNHEDRVHEVWFPGVHADLGGGYKEDGIAKVSLFYMLKKLNEINAADKLSPFLMSQEMLDTYTAEQVDDWHFHFHGYGFGKNLRHINVNIAGKPSDPEVYKPMVHRSYEWICKSATVYSVVEIKEDEKKVTKEAIFQYKPYNFKRLKENFIIVD